MVISNGTNGNGLVTILDFKISNIIIKLVNVFKFQDSNSKRQLAKFIFRGDSGNGFGIQLLERFSYDLEMKTREQNRNSKRTEIERIDWLIERIQTRVAFDWLSERSAEKTSYPRTSL